MLHHNSECIVDNFKMGDPEGLGLCKEKKTITVNNPFLGYVKIT